MYISNLRKGEAKLYYALNNNLNQWQTGAHKWEQSFLCGRPPGKMETAIKKGPEGCGRNVSVN